MNSSEQTNAAVLISQDLFFTSKITGTAQGMGLRVETAAKLDEVADLIAVARPACVLVDLTFPGLSMADFMAALPEVDRPSVVAFGPHVEKVRLDEARAAGCDEVLPRSRFSSTLPEILARYLGEPPNDEG